MPKGLKTTSSPLQISAGLSQTATNTFIFEEIPLTLNVLDNEVFVITQVNLDVDAPDFSIVPGQDTSIDASISSTQRTSVGGINNSNVIGSAQRRIVTNVGIPGECVSFDREDPLFAAISEDYLAIVATNNMFLNLDTEGLTAGTLKDVRVRVYGYRASASAAVYAALVQSELLSA